MFKVRFLLRDLERPFVARTPSGLDYPFKVCRTKTDLEQKPAGNGAIWARFAAELVVFACSGVISARFAAD
ncbi:MAG: hypothetical protein J5740_05130 [Bacteroidales bacterium]|nr:hypothetical protein [Bacteroidales bacterium]